MVLWWIPAVALATDVSVRQIDCPYGTGLVKVYDLRGTNTAGGYDSDLARYASQGQYRTYAMSTCPDTMFSLYGEDMGDTIDPKKHAAVAQALSKVLATLPNRESPALWDRYAIAAAVYEALGTAPELVGDVYLEASWTARDEAVGVYLGLDGPKAADQALRDGRALLTTADVATRKTLFHNLARVAERAGYPALRDHYLDRFANEALTAKEKAALATFRAAVKAEPRLQDLAIAQYRKALANGHLDGAAEARVQYLLADLLRRRGALEEARELYAKVVAGGAAPADLLAMAGYLQNATGAP
jgi:tetratricopeptide (TPR) repeat protein